MKKANCPNCQSETSKVVLDVSKEKDAYLDYLKMEYKDIPRFYATCQNCQLVYRTPILEGEEKVLLYDHFRDIELRGEDKRQYFQRIAFLPQDQSENYQKCKFLEKYLPQKGSVLDVGCGAGVSLYTFKKYFPQWETFGIEPTKEFADVAQENGINVTYGYLEKGTFNRKFDLIMLIHVLEHVEDFREMISMLKNYLHEESLLYIEVPSVKDIGFLPSSHDRFMSQHEVIFSKEVLQDILESLGYSIQVAEDFRSIRNRNNVAILGSSNGRQL